MLGGYNTYLEALGSQVSGLTTSGRIILSFTPNGNSRSRIYVSNKTNVLFILDLYPRDVTMVKITYISESRRNLLSRQHTFNMTWTDCHQPWHKLHHEIVQQQETGNHHWMRCQYIVTSKHSHQSKRRKHNGIFGELKPEYN